MPEIEQLRSAVAAMADIGQLAPDPVIAAAAKETGLDPVVLDAPYRERLGVLCDSFRTESGLSAFGVFSVVSQLTGNVATSC